MLKEHRFDTGTVEINYAEGPASGPPMVFLHGLATRWQIFKPLMRALSDRWHVFAPDFRGHGKSGRVPGHYGSEDFVDDTIAFLQAHLNEPAVLFGHSMGGWVAAGVATRAPEAVRAIVLADTAFYLDRVPDDKTLMTLFGVDGAALRSGGLGSVRSWPHALSQLDPDVLASYMDGRLVETFDTEVVLPRVSCPVLILQGNPAEGGLLTDQSVARALPLLANATHVRFDDTGHWLHVQKPDEVIRETTRFLESVQ